MTYWITFAFDGKRKSQPLGGPYPSLEACKADKSRVVEEACKVDGNAWFFHYVSEEYATGTRTRFGDGADPDSIHPKFRKAV